MKTLAASLLAVLAFPAAASALKPVIPVIPPGNSAANQYVESVPTAGGGTSSSAVYKRGHGGKPGGASTPALAASQSYLRRQGTDGRGLTALLRATAAPTPASVTASHGHGKHTAGGAVTGGSGGGSGGGPGRIGTPVSTAGATSGGAAVANSLTGLGGASSALWIVLLAATLGVVVAAVARLRAHD